MDIRRLEVSGLAIFRLRTLLFMLKNKMYKDIRSFIWTNLFTRDSGLALLDPLIRKFPKLAGYPQAIEVEVTTRCHLKCIICENTYWQEPPQDMTFDEFKKIVDQFPNLHWINVSGIGEQFLNKDFLKMLRYLKERGVYVELFSTFHLINEKIAEELINLGINKIWISIDAAKKETYEQIRCGAKFEKVINNIKQFFEIKNRKNSLLPEVWFHYIVIKQNLEEIIDFFKLAIELTQNNRKNTPIIIYLTNILSFKEVKHLVVQIPNEYKKKIKEEAKKLGIYIIFNENTEEEEKKLPLNKCTKWTEPFVLATGHVQPCCAINEANEREYQKKYAFGNLFHQHFKDIWYSEELDKFKMLIHNGELPKICKNCRLYRLPK